VDSDRRRGQGSGGVDHARRAASAAQALLGKIKKKKLIAQKPKTRVPLGFSVHAEILLWTSKSLQKFSSRV
jgi:hypothetical protein